MQLEAGATGAVQLLMKVNSEAFAPLSETDDTWSGPVPELITVSVCVVPDVPWVIAGNDGSAGVRLTSGTAATPVPFSARVCGLPGALSATWSVAENAPALAGKKLMLTEQFALGASTDPQVLVSEKLEALGPLMEMELMERF